MLLSLVDSLRCIAPHDESVLVLSVDAWREDRIERGTLGCPVCRAEYPIENAVADFSLGQEADVDPAPPALSLPPDEEAMRLAALLDLAEPGGIVFLAGGHATLATVVGSLVPVVSIVPSDARIPITGTVVSLTLGDRLPLARGSLRGAAVAGRWAGDGRLGQVVSALAPGARLVAPVASALPAGATRIASDARDWVAEVDAASSPLLTLRRSRGP